MSGSEMPVPDGPLDGPLAEGPLPGPARAPDGVAPPAAGDPARIGSFRLVGRLGAGGMGRVYLGVSRAGRPTAVKVVRADLAEEPVFRRRFAAEVAAARRVQGPYTPAVVAADPDAELPWLATSYIAGPSLGETVEDGGPLTPLTARRLGAGVAEALGAIHAAGVVHRDLKPSNVLLDADGPKVIDFGIAAAADATRLTSTGVRLGTLGFMSPEQADGRPVTRASDIFALGCVLAYAVTGRPPFGDGPPSEVLYRVINAEPDPGYLDCGDPELSVLIGRCLRKWPADRPTVDAVIDACATREGQPPGWPDARLGPRIARAHAALERALGGGSSGSGSGDSGRPVAESRTAGGRGAWRSRRGAVAGVLLGVAAVAVVLAVVLTTGGDEGGDEGGAKGSGARYTAGYKGRTLTLPDYDHYIDLPTGKVVKGDGRWMLSTNSGGDGHGALELQDATEAQIAGERPVTPERCAELVAHRPLREKVRFAQAPAGRWFCMRDRISGDVAVVQVLDTDSGDYTVTVAVDYYRRAATG
ncbi:serine/threonine-protein kinase [Streptomyces sp. NBS 14/10]|uniref:serine/threonine-protein kinase n=1 Tax=Streptomyces sp. NBS 14/10 TaxID=1945643 RepID=UPI00211B6B00|nr:serine/threonine-protein kinase [Streptomyces sp. NBS 14/10]KAK1181265.1 serine/threonine-protein kinase [Streptomyces sp. NBS 14/10]